MPGLTNAQMRDAWVRMRAVRLIPVRKRVRWGNVQVFRYERDEESEGGGNAAPGAHGQTNDAQQ